MINPIDNWLHRYLERRRPRAALRISVRVRPGNGRIAFLSPVRHVLHPVRLRNHGQFAYFDQHFLILPIRMMQLLVEIGELPRFARRKPKRALFSGT